ncbi:hypothetical protein [Methylocystis rosea]|uniref:Uncharacterized protein n=1 Tax=Methylocystis rosea TaxID=173366 RepID=A0A3G8M3V3_9HYPH|nr:hypothetical protein [Methylocystis rosea]AZG75985.1 hypothetical protein EHO51_04135 [Methylocystis rosea]
MDFNDLHALDKQRLIDLGDACRALPDHQATKDARILLGVLMRRYRAGDDSQLGAVVTRLRVIAATAEREEFPQLALNAIVGAKARAASSDMKKASRVLPSLAPPAGA